MEGSMVSLLTRCAFWAIIAGALTLAGCGAPTPPPTFYQLEEVADVQLSGIDRGTVVGVGPINIPPYLNRPLVVTRATNHRLNLSEFNRWAEPLSASVSRVIAVHLSNMLETTRVFSLPRSSTVIPLEFRVEIDVARFDGTLGQSVILVARWSLYDNNDEVITTKVSIIEEAIGGDGYDALISAQNRTLEGLSREITTAIKST
jgi:uncharacterized lipoprotein YmbA